MIARAARMLGCYPITSVYVALCTLLVLALAQGWLG